VGWIALLEQPFFIQMRIGRGERAFRLVKLKTLRTRRDASGALLPDAERLSAYGRWLRASSLDELPQLLHVLRGQMSLVGPRPLLPDYLPHYNERQRLRHRVRPGLTGLAQISGRNALSWAEQLELDAQYAERQSLGLDLRVLWATPGAWLGRRGIAAAGHATRPRFDVERTAERER
jgi:lipopolysaccharide/colanic/teichoic acid biosynthesis glycosyltransferase